MYRSSDLEAFSEITIVSLEQAVAAPFVTRRFAQAGASVIKIERPEGDFARYYDSSVFGESSYFAWLNAGRKSVVLNLVSEPEVSLLKSIIDRSDILVQNLKPGALEKLGFDLKSYHEQRPEFISLSISGFYPGGPGGDRKAYDLLIQAESGLSSITGTPDGPGRVGVSIVDLATGMYGYQALLEALVNRQATGVGKLLNVSLFDSIAEWLAVPYLLDRYGNGPPERIGLAHPGICPYGVFVAEDGESFVLSIQNEREWSRLCEVVLAGSNLLKDERCLTNEIRVANRAFVDDSIAQIFRALPYSEIERRLFEADLAFAPVKGIEKLKDHSDFRVSEALVGDAKVELPVTPGNVYARFQKVPLLGEHTREVLESLNTKG